MTMISGLVGTSLTGVLVASSGGEAAAQVDRLSVASLPSPVAEPDWVVHPRWIETPTAWDVQHAFRAFDRGSGAIDRAVIYCRVDEKGRLVGCEVVGETTPGFGAAALGLVPRFRMWASDAGRLPVAGRLITIPFEHRPRK
jgi:hypothetical protein